MLFKMIKTNVYSSCQLLLVIVILICHLKECLSYECYVCKDQDNNNEKCIKTVKSCDVGENSCLTVVRWGSTPYWDPTGSKQFYVSKQCATSALCENMKQNTSNRCDRIWFNDWECVECCTGDRCNYFITLGAGSIKPMTILATTIISSAAIFIAYFGNYRL